MKIEQQPREFQPITITLESEKDIAAIVALIEMAMGSQKVMKAYTHEVAMYLRNNLQI